MNRRLPMLARQLLQQVEVLESASDDLMISQNIDDRRVARASIEQSRENTVGLLAQIKDITT